MRASRIACLALLLAMSISTKAQVMDTLPFFTIPDYPQEYTASTVIVRLIEGLGFRYHWASEGLTDKDLSYSPSEGGRTALETLEHIHSLARTTHLTIKGLPIEKSSDTLTYTQLRAETLGFLDEARRLLLDPDFACEQHSVTFKRGEKESSYPMWHLINGQIADAIWHVGQIVSFRRSSGNPLNPKVNVFTGKLRE